MFVKKNIHSNQVGTGYTSSCVNDLGRQQYWMDLCLWVCGLLGLNDLGFDARQIQPYWTNFTEGADQAKQTISLCVIHDNECEVSGCQLAYQRLVVCASVCACGHVKAPLLLFCRAQRMFPAACSILQHRNDY